MGDRLLNTTPDTLQPGQMLVQYRIIKKIGEGGMGEVYSARDTRLERDVAVKILPPAFAEDAQRINRFEREAKAVAALSHPNIMAIHDFGRQGDIAFAVAELLEGDSLRDVLTTGALPFRKAVDYARQAANGLAAAHERGIIHRDLKPDNLFIGRDGRLKILDFGLARVTEMESPAQAGTEAPTAAIETTPGVVMGSAGYMSPEQVRGRPVDSRSDIFSLGAVLYEMLTGQRAFRGDSAVETMSAILKEDPPELSSAGQPLPGNVERIVLHCLEKNAAERFQSARDLAFQLGALGSTGSSGSQPVAALEGSTPSRPWPLALMAAGLVLGLLAGAAVMWTLAPAPIRQFSTFAPLTFRQGMVRNARFTADGQTVVYSASWNGKPFEMFSTQMGVPGSRPLNMGIADLLAVSSTGELAISMDRRFIIGWETSGTLARAPLQGGAPREVLQGVHEADWSPDGTALAVARQIEGRYVIEYPIGNVIYETTGWVGTMRVSPDGQTIAFLDHPLHGDNVGSLSLLAVSGQKTPLGSLGGNGLAWSPDGSELWVKDGPNLQAVTRSGETRLIGNSGGYSNLVDVASDGRVLMADSDIRREVVAGTIGGDEVNLSWFNWTSIKGLSADGTRVLFQEEGLNTPEYLLFIRDTADQAPIQLSQGSGLALSPDGKWALSFRNMFTDPKPELVPTGAGQPRPLDWGGLKPGQWAQWMPDGSGIMIAGRMPDGTERIFLAPLDGGAPRPITPEGASVGLPYHVVSPDGTWLATTSQDRSVALFPLAGGEPRELMGTESGEVPIQWNEDGKSLYVYNAGVLPARIFRVDIDSGARELVHDLLPADASGVFNIDVIMLTTDGRSYAYSYRRMLTRLYTVSSIQ